MNALLYNLVGVVCLVDDILVFGTKKQQHDERLHAVIKRLEAAGITLNISKCEFLKNRVKYLGHVIDKDGIQTDPQKVSAIEATIKHHRT